MNYALITGASKGIGKAIAEELASRNINVLLIARSTSLLQELSDMLKIKYRVDACFFAIDLSEKDATQKIIQWCKLNNYSVNILVNNAGYGLSGKFENYSIHDYANNMQVNMSVPVELCHAFLPDFHKLPRAYILNICSTAAFQAVPGLSVYAASKSFLLSFSRALNYELRKTRISVTAVSPGTTDTDFANRANVGAKALKAGKKMNMKPGVVARMAVTAMFKGKTEITTGFMNKLGGFLAWLFPKRIAENIGGNIYEV